MRPYVNHLWFIGQKVICVDDSFHSAVCEFCAALPVAGHVYAVRAIRLAEDPYIQDSGLGLWLEEIVNPEHNRGESGFFCDRFRPLLDKLENIAASRAAILKRQRCERVIVLKGTARPLRTKKSTAH